jgi:heme/copper-type cytochrome/quinol oxidase subunit 4
MGIILSIYNLLLNDWASGHRADYDRDGGITIGHYIFAIICIPVLLVGGYLFLHSNETKDKVFGAISILGAIIGAIFLIYSCVN